MQNARFATPKMGVLRPLKRAFYFSISPICFFINEDLSLSYPQFANNQPSEWYLLKEVYYDLFSCNIYLIFIVLLYKFAVIKLKDIACY